MRHTPKKLTDCPENLREAIDWLIQVRYGNGGNDGLGELAKALKRLIEEATTSATKSLTTRENQLQCKGKGFPKAFLAAAGSSDSNPVSHCDEVSEKINSLKSEIKTASESEKSKKEKELKKLQSGLDEHIAKDHSLDESARQAKIEEVKKHQEFVKEFQTNFNNALKDGGTNILTHLCDGLEKFLGYDKDSKGYTGRGIVYSDLDRLCDAVMGFLSGVLDAVKDDPSVKTYDMHETSNFNNAIETIKNNMHKSGGLSAAVGAVSEALVAWDREVTERINKVVKDGGECALTVLKNKIGENITALEKLKTEGKFQEIVNKWHVTATRDISKCVKNAESAIVQLDSSLRNSTMSDFETIKTQVNILNESTINDVMHLSDVNATIKSELKEMEKEIRVEISQRVVSYREMLNTKFHAINEDINAVSDNIANNVRTLNEWIQQAEELVKNAIPQIEAILNVIDNKDKGHKKYPEAIKNKADEFQRKADALREAVRAAKLALDPLVDAIKGKVTSLEQVYKKVLGDLQQSVEQQVQQAHDALGRLDAHMKSDLSGTVQTHIQSEITKVITAFKKGVNKSKDYKGYSPTFFIQDFWEGLGYGRGDAPALAAWAEQAKNKGDGFHDAVEQLNNGRGRFDHLKKILQNLMERNSSGKDFFESIIADLDKKLIGAIRTIGSKLQTHMKQYYDHSKAGGAIHGAIGEVKNNVNAFFGDKGGGDISTNNLQKHQYDRVGVDKKIEEIQSMGLSKFTEFDNAGDTQITSDTFTNLKSVITENLQNLVQEIRTNANDTDGVKQKLLQLQSKYFRKDHKGNTNSIYKIHEDLGTLHSQNIRDLIQKSNAFLGTTIPTEATKCIDGIYSLLNSAVTRAKRSIRDRTMNLYVTTKCYDLGKLKEFVENQRKRVANKIGIECSNGVKGLLKSMLKDDGKGVTSLKTDHGITALATKACTFMTKLVTYVQSDVKNVDTNFAQLTKFNKSIEHFTYELINDAHFSHPVSLRLSTLSSATSALDPQALPDAGRPVLKALRDGMMGFVGELGKGYVSRYDGGEGIKEWVKREGEKDVLTPEGRNGAKVFLTILNTLCEDLPYLENKCKENSKYSWKHKTISEKHDNKENALGYYLKRCGYAVAKDEHSKDGELNFPYRDYKGGKIYQKLNEIKFVSGSTIFQHLLDCDSNVNERGNKIKEDNFTIFELLNCLLSHVDKYNEVCHYATTFSKRQPCTVYEMLVWCSGLTYNPVYHELQLNGFNSLLDKPKSKGSDGNKDEDEEEEGPTVEDSTALGLDAYPSDITFNSVHDTITHITSKCHDILTTIVGTGDAETVYACDYSNNYLALSYPADPAQCFETLLDILRRLLPQLRYLLTKCSTKAEHNGWRNCEYGKDVPTSKSHCNEQPSDKVTSKAACQPTCQANSKVNCQPTSPLMSYLNDCLPGHLPHHVTSIGCKSVCSNCPRNKPGQPCITPLGFRGFSCSTRTGKQLYDILVSFLGDVDLSRLMCLLPKPPATLPEHFGFALSLVNGWENGSKYSKTLKKDIDSSISSVSIKLYVNPDNFSSTICNAYGSTHIPYPNKPHLPAYADLSSLAVAKPCTVKDVKCAPYLSSLNCDSYYHLAKKNSGLYLSWAIYLPWTFWQLLNNLYNAFCSINCQDWGCRGCLRGDKCKKGSHGFVDTDKPSSICQCSSIVDCKGVAPTLYQYGFVFGEASTLNDKASPKKCSDFCTQLKKVLESQYFVKLFEECDNFLWTIRTPFSYLVLALWLLSLLYLLHIMVIRLDLLHIKSHLHSPSSHRIAAQSLLASGRVNKLGRVFYLQP